MKPSRLFIIGGILVLIGFVVPFLMVLDIVPMVLWLEMIIAVFQMLGLIMGIMGSVLYVKEKRDKNDKY